MRTITVKYAGECAKCGASIPEGAQALYERGLGIFCTTCTLTDDELREARQDRNDKKASKYEEWAEKRRKKAQQCYATTPDSLRHDWAFITQPGHIPARERMVKADERGWEHDKKAAEMEAKAKGLRSGAGIKGDRERKRAALREKIKPLLKVGMVVDVPFFQNVTIIRLNEKSITIQTASGYTERIGYDWVSLPRENTDKEKRDEQSIGD